MLCEIIVPVNERDATTVREADQNWGSEGDVGGAKRGDARAAAPVGGAIM